MSEKPPLNPALWTERTVDETVAVYRDWAATYDADVDAHGYRTPPRLAAALAPLLNPCARVLDFGCGTGVSGAALRAAGLGPLHGTDITPEMIEIAGSKGIYDRLWLSAAGQAPTTGAYDAIVAAGVVSLGAAPPETLDLLLDALEAGGLLALSFNDPTLADGRYDARLQARLADGSATLVSREHGPHLDDMDMGSDVIVMRRA